MAPPSNRLRRRLMIVAAALALGVAAHGACQAIEHHDAMKHAVALCAAAVAVVGVVALGAGRRRRAQPELPRWVALASTAPVGADVPVSGSWAAWLQRFRN
jgi:peptidoglycan/LPS O-acetylase OafA/YrhL